MHNEALIRALKAERRGDHPDPKEGRKAVAPAIKDLREALALSESTPLDIPTKVGFVHRQSQVVPPHAAPAPAPAPEASKPARLVVSLVSEIPKPERKRVESSGFSPALRAASVDAVREEGIDLAPIDSLKPAVVSSTPESPPEDVASLADSVRGRSQKIVRPERPQRGFFGGIGEIIFGMLMGINLVLHACLVVAFIYYWNKGGR